VAVVLVVAGVAWLVNRGGESPATAGGPTQSPGASASASADQNNPCQAPTVKPAASPKSWSTPPPADLAKGKTWQWVLRTTCGDVVVTLDGAKAQQAVASTIFLTQQGFYNGVTCHRLTTEGIFVLQCGDPKAAPDNPENGSGGPGYSYGPVENAPKNDVYPAGTVAMARIGGKGDSMGSQFFLVYKDSSIPHDAAGGYTVMGKITGGMDVVEKVAAGGLASDGVAPRRAISIVTASAEAG
jgi:peptidyl-prolyl cis-trans isomerase B (cyclophilin B)